ncbi:DNA polymerase IV [Propioniciclava tarda]|uniref:DNA polymerase IV n=1 Tax=Propioniciclava tarda TaxID=433330 RepID=A0A4Q9KKM9_PROTD|nr:DNA polymerase IV [Propioniciclava tarda]TBT94745.1 DNA polymerase IV [Propioniciclava tarda]SMO64615.1 DNA polymerase-4 [Propioniciclava tarda]HOA88231.1 DNA polymerase IV [Propioniciclava tarda]HQA30582.1 DNA polymerase IV [Propioniciclava tarda]HQD60051.1 DNA polymerase IV [Propioniciclava tarda]
MPVIMHVDMDAFYASVELRRHPELKGRPMWVGGESRGVVLSASYEARAFGVEGGMSSTRARRLCPDAVAVSPDHDTYSAVSEGVFAIFSTITPTVEPMSLDEAFLDVTGAQRLLGSPRQIGELIRAMVADEQGVPCSVGIGPSKFIAKLASNAAKPNGLVEVPPTGVISFLHPLGVEKIWGVGPATASALHKIGLRTVSDIAHTPRSTLQRALGAQLGAQLHDLAWGVDARRVIAHERERSVGSQETFSKDTDDLGLIEDELLRVSSRVASRMRAARVLGRTVTVHVRFADFRVVQRSATLRSPTDATGDVHASAVKSLRAMRLDRPRIRRVGVRVEGLVNAETAYQQPMLGEPDHGWRDAERAADAAVARFGPRAVQRATLAGRRRP